MRSIDDFFRQLCSVVPGVTCVALLAALFGPRLQSSLNQRLELERQRRRVAEDTITALQTRSTSSNQDAEIDVEEGFTPSS